MAYIDRELMCEKVKEMATTKFDWSEQIDVDDFEKVIKELPTADVVEVKQIEIIRDDLKWWLETNSEKGVVYIPKYVVENMIAKMDSQL